VAEDSRDPLTTPEGLANAVGSILGRNIRVPSALIGHALNLARAEGRLEGLNEAASIVGGEDPSGGMVSVTYLLGEIAEAIEASSSDGAE
jgi:hypothetical protein